MATGTIKKTGLIPKATGMVYDTNYQISDNTIGKYISLNGARTFYSPGIAETLETAQSGSLVLSSASTINVQAVTEPGNNQITFVVYLSQAITTTINVKLYANFTLTQGGSTTQGGTGMNTVNIPSGSTFGSTSIAYFYSPTETISNIQTIITDIPEEVTFKNVAGDLSKGTFTSYTQYTVSIPSQFSNPLNIPDFNVSTINFYGANRDTLILQGSKLTS